MASMSTEPPFGRAGEEEDNLVDSSDDDDCEEVMEVRRRVSRFAVDGDSGAGGAGEVARRRVSRFAVEEGGGAQQDLRRGGGIVEGVRALPPPHAWLAVEETRKAAKSGGYGSENEEQWARLLQRGGSAQAEAAEAQQQRQPRRSSFSVVRRERVAREAWLDRAWEMKRSWHERNGGAPNADIPVVVVVGAKQQQQQHGGSGSGASSPSCSSPHRHQHGAAGSVAMDMEEVRACRDLGLELPSDCTVEIQCYGISTGSSPTHSSHAGSGSESPSTPRSCSISSPSAGEDPVDVKARLKVWAQAVALASTTHLGS